MLNSISCVTSRPSIRAAHSRHVRVGCKPDKPDKGSDNGAASNSEDRCEEGVDPCTLWAESVPSYLQSTQATDVCDEWTDAIQEAEAVATARQEAIAQGLSPEEAEKASRDLVRTSRSTSVWKRIRQEAERDIQTEPMLSSFLFTSILSHESFGEALAFVLSNRIADETLLPTQLFSIFRQLEKQHPEVLQCALADLEAVYDRDPACSSYSQALLYFKGYHGIQLYRYSHALWESGRKVMALLLQSRLSEVLAVDIHPAAKFGRGILLDHGTGVVIGETAVVGNGATIMQNVTLGGTGKVVGDRHPKLKNNVLVGAGASILGNIEIGTGAQVVAGSLVLKPVQPHTMVAGAPAVPVCLVSGNPAASLEQWRDPPPESAGDVPTAAAQRLPKSRLTAFGGSVPVYSEADYYRHADAEKHVLYGSTARSETGIPEDWRPGSTDEVTEERSRVAQAREEALPVRSTQSDLEAERLWGNKLAEPEFFI